MTMPDFAGLLRQLVIAFDGDDPLAFDDAMDAARAAVGLELVEDAEHVLEGLKKQHAIDHEDDLREERRARRAGGR